ncbi:MAG TPA: hypothetical protein VN700_02440 [Vicinamibacterales bacterium]|nr:hypothetical protein [Vicinamibacterales bacterium]
MTIDEAVSAVENAPAWDARVALVRQVPENFGTAAHQEVFSEIAKRIYVPHLAPDFAYIHWTGDYELAGFQTVYDRAHTLTAGFTRVSAAELQTVLETEPSTLRVFRTMLGLTPQEFAAASIAIADREGIEPVGVGSVKGMESGSKSKNKTPLCAKVIDEAVRGVLFGSQPTSTLRPKTDKPDTLAGWDTIRAYAASGVPLAVFLHQRHYGGAFRQLLDATSTKRGDLLEDAVESALATAKLQFIRTGSHNQAEIATRFGITIKPAPDFVVFSTGDILKAILECKGANDGGTARDKASRFAALKGEATRLGGVPLFAVLAGLGWRRTADALGPVVRSTDGRVFTLPTLGEMLSVQPLSELATFP